MTSGVLRMAEPGEKAGLSNANAGEYRAAQRN